jgi:hypothetical protein
MSLINRHASRAAEAENLDAIGDLDAAGAELVVRGVAERRIDPYRTTSGNTIIPRQGYAPGPAMVAHAYSPFSGELPAHVADQMTPGRADRTAWAFFQWLQDRHLLPSAAVLAGLVCGWGTALTEPDHVPLGAVTTAFGLVGALGYGGLHVIRSINSDSEPMHRSQHAVGLLGLVATAFGVVCITGPSFYGVGVTLLELGVAYWAYFEHRHSRLSDQREFTVAYHAAVTQQIVAVSGDSGAAMQPLPLDGQVLSHEETMVRNAFDGIGIGLSDIYGFSRINESSFAVTVVLAPAKGISPDAIIRRREEIKSALQANQVLITKTRRGHEVRITARYGEIDELAETIEAPGITVRSIKEPIPLGPAATGEMSLLHLLGNHTVIGGTTNNGKSGLVNNIVTQVVPMKDARLVLLDCKPGQLELGIYEDVAYASADSFERAALILKALVAVMNIRGAKLKKLRLESGKPARQWDTEDGPALVVVIDELAELFRDLKQTELKKIKNDVLRDAIEHMNANFVRLCQVARAYAISLVIATQKPDALAAGGVKSGVDQAQNRLCVATTSSRLTNIVLREGAHGEGFKATELDVAGKFLMITLKEALKVERKSFWWTDERIAEVVEQNGEDLAPLADDEDDAFKAILAGRKPDFEIPSPFDDPDGTEDEWDEEEFDDTPAADPRHGLRLVPEYPDGSVIETKYLACWEMLATFGDRGATVADLSVAAKRAGHENSSLAWVRNLCAEWRAAGYVVVEQQGRDFRYWRDDAAVRQQLRMEA